GACANSYKERACGAGVDTTPPRLVPRLGSPPSGRRGVLNTPASHLSDANPHPLRIPSECLDLVWTVQEGKSSFAYSQTFSSRSAHLNPNPNDRAPAQSLIA